MPEKRRQFDPEFGADAVQIIRETGTPTAQVGAEWFELWYYRRVTDVHVLHVFTDAQGNFGDIATVIFDQGHGMPDDARQEIARNLEAVETAFVNDAAAHQVSFMHGQGEIDFAGVPAVGVAWLLGQREGMPISQLEGRGGKITVTQESG